MSNDPLARLRSLCLALPESREVEAWGSPTFRGKTIFASYVSSESGYGDGRPAVWIKAVPETRDFLVRAAPDRFFVPPYVGVRGWVGTYLDHPDTDWQELERLLWDAWRMSVGKRLAARYPERQSDS